MLHPAANDIDPTGGELSLTAVLPDAVQGTDEHAELAAHILSVNGDGGNEVVLKAGTEPGTMAFTYTVENSRGDVGVGLIVMTVLRASIPDHPVIADTVVTLDERATFESGIDVVTGKVSWTAGDVNDLTLSIWGDPHGVRASGWKLSGEAPDAGLLLPFALTGTNFAGVEVTSYGFLRIPPVRDVILSLKPDLAPQKVKEGESLTFDMAPLVAIPAGETLEIGRGDVAASGQRPGGSCQAGSGTRIGYEAGEGQPWTDSCVVPVRLAGGDDYTHLVVPIEVTPKDPQPELRPASITASPGAGAVSYDLKQMVQWQGKADPSSLVFAIDQAADQFTVTQDGERLTVTALDTATPGLENPVTVRLSSHPNTPPAVLSLRVGPAPSALPKGGTIAQECSQNGQQLRHRTRHSNTYESSGGSGITTYCFIVDDRKVGHRDVAILDGTRSCLNPPSFLPTGILTRSKPTLPAVSVPSSTQPSLYLRPSPLGPSQPRAYSPNTSTRAWPLKSGRER